MYKKLFITTDDVEIIVMDVNDVLYTMTTSAKKSRKWKSYTGMWLKKRVRHVGKYNYLLSGRELDEKIVTCLKIMERNNKQSGT